MRILYDSKKLQYKTPFGPLTSNETCTMTVHVPSTVQAAMVSCIINRADGSHAMNVDLPFKEKSGPYDIFQGSFSIFDTGLYFYYFYVSQPFGGFRLFKQGDDTNMEAGDFWQLSCIPAAYPTPEWAKGAVIYQIFPDRFNKSGNVDLTDATSTEGHVAYVNIVSASGDTYFYVMADLEDVLFISDVLPIQSNWDSDNIEKQINSNKN